MANGARYRRGGRIHGGAEAEDERGEGVVVVGVGEEEDDDAREDKLPRFS